MLDYLFKDIRNQTKKLRKSLKKGGRKGSKCKKPRRKSVKYNQGG